MKVVIAGGGLIGLSIAFELIERDCSVEVIDGGEPVAAYRASAGMLALASEAQALEAALVELARDSQRLYPAFVERIEAAARARCNLATAGALYVALHRDHVAAIAHLQEAQARLQVPAVRLSSSEIRQREPLLSPSVIAGLFAHDERQVDPRRLHTVLRSAVAARGGRLVPGTVVALTATRDHIDGVEIVVDGEHRRLECDHVVVAAGAWSRKLLAPILGEIPLRPVKGVTIRCRGKRLIQHVIRSPDVYLVPMSNDELLIGASVEEVGFDASVNFGELTNLAIQATQVLPGIKELGFGEASVGLRPVLRDGLPALGPTRVRGLHLAIGHSRHGVSLVPATASVVADGVVHGEIVSHYRALSCHRLEGATA
jgi:glycine oxidase